MARAGADPGGAGGARAENILGAVALALADSVRRAAENAVGQRGALAAALVTVSAYPGRSIEQLNTALGLSQPGAVRLVDRLEAEGWVERRRGAGRALALRITPAGERVVAELLEARRRVLADALAPLSQAERRTLTALLERLAAAQTHDRGDLERVCRLCERSVCERCPVDAAVP
jgi:DNA-binding MarR family transcriptional regulator